MPPAPSPLTPTPYRFLPTSTTRPKPTSTPRPQQQTPQSCSQQFVPTPRFSFTAGKRSATLHHDATQDPGAAGSLSSPLVPGILRYRPRLLVRAKERAEDVDSEREEEDEQQKEDSHGDGSITRTNTTIKHSTPPPSSPPPPHKRRRFKPPTPTSPLPPSLPAPHPHFLTTPPAPPLPKFLLPTRPSPPAPTALTFSPQRRAQKFVAGGLAASLRDLVVETALQGSRDARARWDLRIRACEVRSAAVGVGMVLVRGVGEEGGGGSEEGGAKGWVLIGRAAHEEVTRGCTIGVRRPVWEVDVLGERWAVGVEWGVLAP